MRKDVGEMSKEWIAAVQREKHYTKGEIITMYLNKVDFGANNTLGLNQQPLFQYHAG
jgi:membrane peptidoglycan carboxypeptidase